MSTYHVIAGYGDYYVQDGSTVIYVEPGTFIQGLDLDTSDVLSDPEVESLLPSTLALWPRGAAWGSPDGRAIDPASVLAGFSRALTAAFNSLYGRLWTLTAESRSATLIDSLPDWEADFGLPEPCAENEQSEAERLLYLRTKIASDGYLSPADFVRLADFLGFAIAIEEPDAFKVGESSCGSSDEVSDVALDQQWVVHVKSMTVERFEAGIGETGVTRLLDYDAGAIECVFRRTAPAWTYPIFDYEGWPVSNLTIGYDNEPLLTEDDQLIEV